MKARWERSRRAFFIRGGFHLSREAAGAEASDGGGRLQHERHPLFNARLRQHDRLIAELVQVPQNPPVGGFGLGPILPAFGVGGIDLGKRRSEGTFPA